MPSGRRKQRLIIWERPLFSAREGQQVSLKGGHRTKRPDLHGGGRGGFQSICPGGSPNTSFPNTSAPHTGCPWLPLARPGRAVAAGCGANFTSRLWSQRHGRDGPQSSRTPGKGRPRFSFDENSAARPGRLRGFGSAPQTPNFPGSAPAQEGARAATRPRGQVMPALVQEVPAPGDYARRSPLLPTQGPTSVSPTRLGTPRGKSCTDRGAPRAQTAARSACGARAS